MFSSLGDHNDGRGERHLNDIKSISLSFFGLLDDLVEAANTALSGPLSANSSKVLLIVYSLTENQFEASVLLHPGKVTFKFTLWKYLC